MGGCRAISDMTERIAQRAQFMNLPIDVRSFFMEHVPLQVGHPVPAEHGGDLVQGEPGRFSHRDQLELQQHLGWKLPTQPVP